MDLNKLKRLVIIQVLYLLNCCIYRKSRFTENSVTCIIFSRDRAMQLETLLNSIERYALKNLTLSFNIVIHPIMSNHINNS